MLLLILVLSGLGRIVYSADRHGQPPHGTYCLFSLDDAREMEQYFSLSAIEGVSFRYSWKLIEPAENSYVWDSIDENMEKTAFSKKKAMLRVLPGFHSPTWLRDKGVKYLSIASNNERRRQKFGEHYQTPLPWDEIYLEAWLKMINAMGKRYDSHKSIILVHMAGPTVYSAEMHLPKNENRKVLQRADYTKQKIITAWKKVIDAYATNFPTKFLSLNLALPLNNDGAMEEIVAYAQKKIGNRLCIQGNFLSGKTKTSFHVYKYLQSFRDDDTVIIGFQMAAPAGNVARMGTLESAIDKGRAAGARYFEIYPGDCLDLP